MQEKARRAPGTHGPSTSLSRASHCLQRRWQEKCFKKIIEYSEKEKWVITGRRNKVFARESELQKIRARVVELLAENSGFQRRLQELTWSIFICNI